MSDPKYSSVGDPLDRLMEECAELIHACCKAKRFGIWNWHPKDVTTPNWKLILNEADDVCARIEEVRTMLASLRK